MRILVVGGGGREHALCWAIAASPLCTKLYCAPGNAGIAQVAECIDVAAEDIAGQVALAVAQGIDFVVVGPEVPLAAGLADRLTEADIKVFGPSAKAAQIESSKGFTKELCKRHNIPTCAFERFTDADKAAAYIKAQGAPIVVKADGLAAGKGVVVAESVEQAIEAARDMLSGNRFGAAGSSVVIEEFLVGEEASFFALCDGEHALPLVGAQDHKRAFDGDKGPNTGGMGAYSPAPIFDAAMQKRTMDEIILPTARAMALDGTPFKGDLRSVLKGYANDLYSKQGLTLNAANEIEGFLFNGVDAERHFFETGKFEYVNTGGYYHSLPGDALRLFIDSAAEVQRAMGFQNEKDHPEVAPSQFEINYSYSDVVTAADQIQLYKLICRQVATKMGCTASFLPKPVVGVNGNGMHTNVSVMKAGKNRS